MPEPADRAARAFVDIVGQSRPRVAGDGSDPDIPVAATVVLLRDSPRGPEVLMLERPDRGSFAGAWVFPGGKLDDVDWAAGGSEEDAARRAGVRETWEETGLTQEPEGLLTISCWDPPPGLPLRIRTWFFAARAAEGELVLSEGEVVVAEWVAPAELLERHARGEVILYPPTWVTLQALAGQSEVDALLGVLRLAGFRRFETVARRAEAGPMLLWQEDAEYGGPAEPMAEDPMAEDPMAEDPVAEDPVAEDPAESPAPAPASIASPAARHRLELASLPWVYTRFD